MASQTTAMPRSLTPLETAKLQGLQALTFGLCVGIYLFPCLRAQAPIARLLHARGSSPLQANTVAGALTWGVGFGGGTMLGKQVAESKALRNLAVPNVSCSPHPHSE
mmetsp:Transcript_159982/g.282058  ORF Transcript_159982/g.282058 Transcript_159982/m.282058 type:complete len:107 (-) Transcript_159982:196-516(-)